MQNNSLKKEIVVLLVVAILMLAVGCGVTVTYFKNQPDNVQEVTNITKTEKEVTVNENGIADAVEKVYDAVVTVVTYKDSNGTLQAYSSGTGFVYKKTDDKAYILTNYHVVSNNKNVTVTFTNGEIVKATVLGTYMYADVAVLQVDASKILAIAELGSSEKARLGDTAFAIGSPVSAAYGWTVTRGILSGKNRTVTVNMSNSLVSSDNVTLGVLQTDVAINSGNSGGPLCNSNGEVIGITSSKVSSTGIEGIGFAIPIEDALKYAVKLEQGEEIKRPYIGISFSELAIAKYLGYIDTDITKGIYVVAAEAKGAASNAGIKAGDVITKINDVEVETIPQFRYELYKYEVGNTVKITINRKGTEKEINVKLNASP